MKINFFPDTKSEALKIANEYISSTEGLAYDMDMRVEEAKASAEVVCEHRTLVVNCDGETPLKLYYKTDE